MHNNYQGLLPLFRFSFFFVFFQKLTPYPYIFFHSKSFLWKDRLTVKVRKKNHRSDFGLHHFLYWNRSSFRINSCNKFNRWSCSKNEPGTKLNHIYCVNQFLRQKHNKKWNQECKQKQSILIIFVTFLIFWPLELRKWHGKPLF